MQLMQQYVQKSSRTNLPRRSFRSSGPAVLIQPTPPSSEGAGERRANGWSPMGFLVGYWPLLCGHLKFRIVAIPRMSWFGSQHLADGPLAPPCHSQRTAGQADQTKHLQHRPTHSWFKVHCSIPLEVGHW